MTNPLSHITENARRLLEELPDGVTLVAAVKSRLPAEVEAAAMAGITHFGHNYVQEAQNMIQRLPVRGSWHMIGHLQRNKAGKAVELFDLIETLDSLRLAQALDRRAAMAGIIMPVLIEINSGQEPSKAGVMPGKAVALVEEIDHFTNLRVEGLMTMGPAYGNPEDARPYFRATREVFESLKDKKLVRGQMKQLSMGMSNSYRVAIEEGATIIRVGTRIFGPRPE